MELDLNERMRKLPRVDALLADPACALLIDAYGRTAATHALRAELDATRQLLQNDQTADVPQAAAILFGTAARLESAMASSLRRVVNATGIVLHTNLGRAPLSEAALRAMAEAGKGYSNLECDLATGERGSRQVHLDALLRRLTGAEDALVVNNNAAAVMLAVNTVARDGEVITSRGELIEIGGSFRIPDVIETSDARLVETGTTNRTQAADFARAVTPKTRALLKVHPSNYRVVGFTEAPSREQLVALAHERGLCSIEDLGSGTLVDLKRFGLPAEPTVQEAVQAGMDVVTFSGDKLLGGPQAGIVVGRADCISRMKRNPLYRALRVDKVTIAALEATLRAYLAPDRLAERLPVMRMLAQSPETLEARARRLAVALARVPGLDAAIQPAESFAGGGSLPQEALYDFAVAVRLEGFSADALHAAFRAGVPPIVARIADGRVLLHMRTVADAELGDIESALNRLTR